VSLVKLDPGEPIIPHVGDEAYNDTVPFHLMRKGLFDDGMPLTLETTMLLPEGALEHSICGENLEFPSLVSCILPGRGDDTYDVELAQRFGILLTSGAVPDEYLQAIRMGFNLILPLHDRNGRGND
jgi:hypothetical protein